MVALESRPLTICRSNSLTDFPTNVGLHFKHPLIKRKSEIWRPKKSRHFGVKIKVENQNLQNQNSNDERLTEMQSRT